MENTLENKAKFFAQYLGQKVYNRIGWPGIIVNGFVDKLEEQFKLYQSDNFKEKTKTFLELTPLSKITDEDAIDVAKILYPYSDALHTTDKGRDLIAPMFGKGTFLLNPPYIIQTYDYLRSNGYALPWMGLSVEQLIEYGWVKLSDNE